MPAKTLSVGHAGLEGRLIEVESDLSNGLPCFNLIGLVDAAAAEARERVRVAIKNSGFSFPLQRITTNLAPANLPKAGPGFDVAIALSILAANGETRLPARTVMLGELSLEGKLRPINGILALVSSAHQQGLRQIILPAANLVEARLLKTGDVTLLGFHDLSELVAFCQGKIKIEQLAKRSCLEEKIGESSGVANSEAAAGGGSPPLPIIKGHAQAKRALAIAAAGRHNLLLWGPPGSGKTLLARYLAQLLPPLPETAALIVTKIFSLRGLLTSHNPLITAPPFRAIHPTISSAALCGGSYPLLPGEISLAHHGVLFLDEITEFPRSLLELLRQPLEDKVIYLARARERVTFPADFMLVAACNPCPCGYYTDQFKPCTCLASALLRYQKKLSGPFLDRIDLQLYVPRLPQEQLLTIPDSSQEQTQQQEQRQLIQQAAVQLAQPKLVSTPPLRQLTATARLLLQQAITHYQLSPRAFDRLLKVARTIAALKQTEHISEPILAEALQYRLRQNLLADSTSLDLSIQK